MSEPQKKNPFGYGPLPEMWVALWDETEEPPERGDNCPPTADLIDRVAGELLGEAANLIDQHLRICEHCKRRHEAQVRAAKRAAEVRVADADTIGERMIRGFQAWQVEKGRCFLHAKLEPLQLQYGEGRDEWSFLHLASFRPVVEGSGTLPPLNVRFGWSGTDSEPPTQVGLTLLASADTTVTDPRLGNTEETLRIYDGARIHLTFVLRDGTEENLVTQLDLDDSDPNGCRLVTLPELMNLTNPRDIVESELSFQKRSSKREP